MQVSDGTLHPIGASSTLLAHPNIKANFVSSFSSNLIRISPLIDQGAEAIIKSEKC